MAEAKIGDDVKKECLCGGSCECDTKDIFYTKDLVAPAYPKE